MKGRQRRSFTDDCKRQALDLVASSGHSIGSVAKELGLRDSVLRRWVELRGAGREPTAAARRPIGPPKRTQASGRHGSNARSRSGAMARRFTPQAFGGRLRAANARTSAASQAALASAKLAAWPEAASVM